MSNIIPSGYKPATKLPFPAPFILSSVERDWCMGDPDKIVYIKRAHLRENLIVISSETGMSIQDMEGFLDWWCSPKPGTSEVRAEEDRYFNLLQRALNWMARRAGNLGSLSSRLPKSRVEKTMEAFNEVQDWINGRFDNTPANGNADCQLGQ